MFFFHKKCPFWPISKLPLIARKCPVSLQHQLFEIYFQNKFLKYFNKFAYETDRKSSSNPAKSKPSDQSNIVQSFRDVFKTHVKILAFAIELQKSSTVDV